MLTEHTEAEQQDSYIHRYRLTQIMIIKVESYIDKALRAEHIMKHKQQNSSSISRTHAINLNPIGILTGKASYFACSSPKNSSSNSCSSMPGQLNNQWQANEYFECTRKQPMFWSKM